VLGALNFEFHWMLVIGIQTLTALAWGAPGREICTKRPRPRGCGMNGRYLYFEIK
jgi:hypothetical protein